MTDRVRPKKTCPHGFVGVRDRHGRCMCAGCASDRAARARELAPRYKEYTSAKARTYHAENRERRLAENKAWRQAHPARIVAIQAKRRAAKLKATPSWASLAAIDLVYAEAARISEASGILHHVDHIVPLQGKNVCGLHVENNLQILPALDNIAKSNKWDDA